MTRDAAVWLGLVVLGASWFFVHALLCLRVGRARALPVWMRTLALLPPATPIIGVRAGSRTLSALWLACAIAYGLLRWA